jgi:hypothetical protein
LRRIAAALGWLSLGVALGLGSLAALTFAIRAPFEERFGPWRGTSIVGRVPENPWQRVAIATRGLVGLPRSETLYLEASVDEDGQPFEPGCRYRFSGPALPARWWSLTPYDARWELIPNPDGVYSVGSHNATLDERGRFALTMHAGAAGPAELPLDDEPGTWVVLRLYHPEPGVVERLAEIEWPRIQRESCS